MSTANITSNTGLSAIEILGLTPEESLIWDNQTQYDDLSDEDFFDLFFPGANGS